MSRDLKTSGGESLHFDYHCSLPMSDSSNRLPPTNEEHVFRFFINQVTDYAIFLLSPTGEVASWNPGAQRIKGYKSEEIIGKHFRVFYPPDDIASGKPEHELEVAAARGRFEDEGWRLRKDGSRFWANVIITAVQDRSGRLVGFGKVTRDLTERKRSEEQMRELSGRLLKLQDEERGRLGRELHDSVGQNLAAAKMLLDALAFDERLDQAHRKDLEESIRIVESLIREVRTLSYLLYPPMLQEMGLSSAIKWHLDGFSNRSDLEITHEIAPGMRRLPQDIEVALFRVFQESLTNVHRHSGSSTAHVRLVVTDGEAILEVQDQGKGMPAHLSEVNAGSPPALGVGIRGMHERLRQLGGKLEIASTSAGTTIRAAVPLKID